MRIDVIKLLFNLVLTSCFFSTLAIKVKSVQKLPTETDLKNPSLHIQVKLPKNLYDLMKDDWNSFNDHFFLSYEQEKQNELVNLKKQFIEKAWEQMSLETQPWHIFRTLNSELQRQKTFFQLILKYIQSKSNEVHSFVTQLVSFYEIQTKEKKNRLKDVDLYFNYENKLYYSEGSIYVPHLFHSNFNLDSTNPSDNLQFEWTRCLTQIALSSLLKTKLEAAWNSLHSKRKERAHVNLLPRNKAIDYPIV